MPFYFEDANGEKDTIWLGYHPDAEWTTGYDVAFDRYDYLNTSKFGAFIFVASSANPKDSARKVEISGTIPVANISFINGKMPITVKWEDSLFYSSRLPSQFYPGISPRPRARGDLTCNNFEPPYHYCFTEYDSYALTDMCVPEFYWYCAKDSFYFDGSGNYTAEDALEISIAIVPHTWPTILDIKEDSFKDNLNVYPNPFLNEITIASSLNEKLRYGLSNSMGSAVLDGEIPGGSMNPTINTGGLVPGMYILTITGKGGASNFKMIKRH